MNSILKINYLLFLLSIFYGCVNSQPIVENKDTLVDIKTEKKEKDTSGQGVCIYNTDIRRGVMLYFNPDTMKLANTPLISYDDIISYDTVKHVMELTFAFMDWGRTKLIDSLYHRSWVMTLDKKPIYGGWFTLPGNSLPIGWLNINLWPIRDSLKANEIKIKLGAKLKIVDDMYVWHPDSTYFEGTDPRNNRALFDRLKADGKIKIQ